MSIRHRLLNSGMSQYPLQSDNASSINHEVSCEAMSQRVSRLA